jgi:hypothetical protein
MAFGLDLVSRNPLLLFHRNVPAREVILVQSQMGTWASSILDCGRLLLLSAVRKNSEWRQLSVPGLIFASTHPAKAWHMECFPVETNLSATDHPALSSLISNITMPLPGHGRLRFTSYKGLASNS